MKNKILIFIIGFIILASSFAFVSSADGAGLLQIWRNSSTQNNVSWVDNNGNWFMRGNLNVTGLIYGNGSRLTDINSSIINQSIVNYWTKTGNDIYYNTGNVGVGTTSPSDKLTIAIGNGISIGDASSNGGAYLKFRGTNTNKNWLVGNQWNGAYFEITPSTANGGSTFTTPSLVLDNSGNVGIGTTSPTAKTEIWADNTHTTGVYTGRGNLLLYNNQSNADEQGAFLTFGTQYLDPSVQFTTRAAIKGGTDIAGNNGAGYLSFYTVPNGAASQNTERMRIDSSGNVGIGTNNPDAKLEINQTTGSVFLKLTNTGYSPTRYFSFSIDSGGLYIKDNGVANTQFHNNGTAIGGIYATGAYTPPANGLIVQGNVGIGTTSPTGKLDVRGIIYWGDSNQGRLTYGLGNDAIIDGYDGLRLRTNNGATAAMRIDSTGNVGINTTTPQNALNVVGTANVTGNLYTGNVYANNTYSYYNSSTLTSLPDLAITNNLSVGKNLSVSGNALFVNNNTGNVGVGTTSPSTKMHVVGTGWADNLVGSNLLRLESTGTVGAGIALKNANGNYWNIYNGGVESWAGQGKLGFVYSDGVTAASGPKMVLDTNGNLGIGTTSPEQALDVAGVTRTTSSFILKYDTASANSRSWGLFHDSDAWGDMAIKQSTTQTGNTYATKMYFSSTGNVGIGTTSPKNTLNVVGDLNVTGIIYGLSNGNLNGSGTNNYIPKWNSSGSLTNSLIYDNGTGVGIGTTSPVTKLDVVGNANVTGNFSVNTNNLFVNSNTGYVGIGTTTPGNKLEVYNGVVSVTNSGGANRQTIQLENDGSTARLTSTYWGTNSYIPIAFKVAGSDRVTINTNGKVGIGTTAPVKTLDVVGSINVTNGGSLNGQYDYNGGWTANGLSIINGNLYAQTGYFYNISSLQVTTLNINGSIVPYNGFDNQFDLGTASNRWRNLYLGGNLVVNGTFYGNWNNSVMYATGNQLAGNLTNVYLNTTNQFGYYNSTTLSAYLNTSNQFNYVNTTNFGNLNNIYLNTTNQFGYLNSTTLSGNLSALGMVNGGGTLQYIPMWNGTTSINNSNIYQLGGNIGINTSSPGKILELKGDTSGPMIRYNRAGAYYWDVGLDGGSNFVFNSQTGGTVMDIGYLGNVGINTSSPNSPLEIYSPEIPSFTGTGFGQLLINGPYTANNFSTIDFSQTTGGNPEARIGAKFTGSGTYLMFGTSNSYGSGITNTAMAIDYNGNVGIGNSTPQNLLSVGSSFIDANGQMQIRNIGVGVAPNLAYATINVKPNTGDYPLLALRGYGGSSRLYVQNDANNGNVGIGTETPSYKLTVSPATQYLLLNSGDGFQVSGSTIGTGANLVMGLDGSTSNKIQSRDGTTLTWPLALNPFGGNVGINTTTPQNTLNVVGNANVTGSFFIGKTNITVSTNGDVNVW